jgi:hypothetical protein
MFNYMSVAAWTGTDFSLSAPGHAGADGWLTYRTLVGDVNGDGRDDLIWNSTCQDPVSFPCLTPDANLVSVGLSDGVGGFVVGGQQSFGASGWEGFRPFTGDFNGDGRTDLAWENLCGNVTECSDYRIRVALANADGTFTLVPEQPLGRRDWYFYGLHRADLDGDGKDDLFWDVQSWSNDAQTVFILPTHSNGDGTFTLGSLEQVAGIVPVSVVRLHPAMGDFNGDGRTDLVFADRDRVKVVEGIGCRTLADCEAALHGLLPDPAAAADRRSRRVAKKLLALDRKLEALLAKAAKATGHKQAKRYAKARATLDRLVALAGKAAGAGRLGARLVRVEAAADALRELVPS